VQDYQPLITFVEADNILTRLDAFDSSKPYVLAQYANPSESIPKSIDLNKYPKYEKGFPDEMRAARKFEVRDLYVP
jgi:hypothetical protein